MKRCYLCNRSAMLVIQWVREAQEETPESPLLELILKNWDEGHPPFEAYHIDDGLEVDICTICAHLVR